jgi:hypothetical protein
MYIYPGPTRERVRECVICLYLWWWWGVGVRWVWVYGEVVSSSARSSDRTQKGRRTRGRDNVKEERCKKEKEEREENSPLEPPKILNLNLREHCWPLVYSLTMRK